MYFTVLLCVLLFNEATGAKGRKNKDKIVAPKDCELVLSASPSVIKKNKAWKKCEKSNKIIIACVTDYNYMPEKVGKAHSDLIICMYLDSKQFEEDWQEDTKKERKYMIKAFKKTDRYTNELQTHRGAAIQIEATEQLLHRIAELNTEMQQIYSDKYERVVKRLTELVEMLQHIIGTYMIKLKHKVVIKDVEAVWVTPSISSSTASSVSNNNWNSGSTNEFTLKVTGHPVSSEDGAEVQVPFKQILSVKTIVIPLPSQANNDVCNVTNIITKNISDFYWIGAETLAELSASSEAVWSLHLNVTRCGAHQKEQAFWDNFTFNLTGDHYVLTADGFKSDTLDDVLTPQKNLSDVDGRPLYITCLSGYNYMTQPHRFSVNETVNCSGSLIFQGMPDDERPNVPLTDVEYCARVWPFGDFVSEITLDAYILRGNRGCLHQKHVNDVVTKIIEDVTHFKLIEV